MTDNKTTKNALLTVEEKSQLLKNLLADPDDYISRELLVLNRGYEEGLNAEAEETGLYIPRLRQER